MEGQQLLDFFRGILKEDGDVSEGIAAVRTLMEVIKYSESETVQGLESDLKKTIDIIKKDNFPVVVITSSCELFLRFITYTVLDGRGDFSECKRIMLGRGDLLLSRMNGARKEIVKFASKFISDGSKILIHSRSRVVLQALYHAQQRNRFEVFVTVSAPDNTGKQMHKELKAMGIPCTLILDSAVGYVMEQIDFIMVGAESVLESGGIVNKVGSYTMAVCAKEMKKPFYVLTESFKFSRLFPLNQQDLPEEYKYTSEVRKSTSIKEAHPLVDYTPPSYITLLFTDIGILTPSAVSDVLINLHL